MPGKRGRIRVGMITKDGRIERCFWKRPEDLFRRKGYHDLSRSSQLLGSDTPSDLLETGVLANGSEAAFLNTRKRTLDVGATPSVPEAEWLAEYSILLCLRSPKYQRLADELVDKLAVEESWDAKTQQIVRDPAVRIFQAAISDARQLVSGCSYRFLDAGKAAFTTCDTPCWPWVLKDDQWRPMSDISTAQRSKLQIFCPLTPRFVIELLPSVQGVPKVSTVSVSSQFVSEINRRTLHSAEQFIVLSGK